MEQFHKILNITEYSSREEIDAQYSALKREYTDKMFLEGEEGARAANFLRELDLAYQDAIFALNNARLESGEGSAFADVEDALKAGNLEKAQALLDGYTTRDTNWHYYQSNLFYKKNWYTDSKKQLEIALQLDPYNTRARNSLDGLEKIMQGERVQQVKVEQQNQQQSQGNYQGQPQMGGMGCNCCDCLCASLLCNMCGGC